MVIKIPPNARSWEEAATELGVLNTPVYDAGSNGGNLPSGSKMEEGVYLTFRSYWKEFPANRISPEMLGISKDVHRAAELYLSKHRDYRSYVADVETFGNVRRPLGKLPNLGIFTLVKHFHEQITKVDVPDACPKHVISPVQTRSYTAAAAAAAAATDATTANPASSTHRSISRGRRRLDFDGGEQPRRPTPTGTESRSTSGGDPNFESPLAHRGKPQPGQGPHSLASSQDRYDHEPAMTGPLPTGNIFKMSPISTRSGASATAANILYAPSADEMIVNTYLILLVNALGACNQQVTAGWHIDRLALKHTFGSSQLEARTDGFLQMPDDGPVVAIVEVKPHLRSANIAGIKMQETTQMVAWIAEQGFQLPTSRRYDSSEFDHWIEHADTCHSFVILSQDRHEVYITVPQYDANYIKYLKGEADANTPRSFLAMTSYGPWVINDSKSLHSLCCYLLALTLSAS